MSFRKALVSKERLNELHAQDRVKGLTDDQLQQLYVYHVDCEFSDLQLACHSYVLLKPF